MNSINRLYLNISIIEAIYVVYMLRYFRTARYSFEYRTSLNFLFTFGKIFGLNKKQLNHSITKTKHPISHICPFGHSVSWVIAAYLIIRCFLPNLLKKM